MDNFEFVLQSVQKAKTPEDIFGEGTVSQDDIKTLYRRLARDCHPDRIKDPRAEDIFKTLNEMYEKALEKIEKDTYGHHGFVLKYKGKAYEVNKLRFPATVSDYYEGECDRGRVYIEIAAEGMDDLVLDGFRIVKDEMQHNPQSPFAHYLLEPLDTFVASSRRVNVWRTNSMNLYSMKEVMEQYPNGTHPRTAAWMFNRMMEGLGYIHSKGFVHGSVLPPNVLVNPETHGMVFVSMASAVKTGEKAKFVDNDYLNWTAPETNKRIGLTPAADIYMAAKTMMVLMLGGNLMNYDNQVPNSMINFINSCQILAPSRRPQKAWETREEFGKLLKRIFGEKKFHPFEMPKKH